MSTSIENFVQSSQVDGERNLAWPYDIFYEYYVGSEVNKPPWLKTSWRTHNNGGEAMKSANIGFWEVDVIGRCVDDPLFYSALLLNLVYATMILMSENTQNSYTRGEMELGGGGRVYTLVYPVP